MKPCVSTRSIAVLLSGIAILFSFTNLLFADAPQKKSSTTEEVGKLYVLSVWGTNAEDIHDSVETIQNRFKYAMEAGGLNLKSQSDPDNFVQEFIMLSGKDAAKDNVLKTCRSINKKAQKNDVIFVYICCHGITKRINGDNKRYHILFPGVKTSAQMQNIKEYGILRSEILEALNPDKHRLVVLITDAGTRDNDEQIIKYPGDPKAFACYDPGYLMREEAEQNLLRNFLRTNTGLIDWNAASPFGGKDGQGEQSPFYRMAQVHEGVFFSALMSLTLDDKRSLSKAKLFKELNNRLNKSFKFISDSNSILDDVKNSNPIFSNQPTQTLFDFKGRGYVVDKTDNDSIDNCQNTKH